jgi:hypothetical protein
VRANRKGLLQTWEVTGDHIEQSYTIAAQIVDFYYKVHIERSLIAFDAMHISCEDFNIRIMGVDLSPVRVTSGVEVLISGYYKNLWSIDGFYTKQTASIAKGFCNDAMLKRWGLWRGKSDHERDSLRHLATRVDSLMKTYQFQ